MIKQFAVGFEDESQALEAASLASQLKVAVDNQAPYQLCLTSERLVLKVDSFSPLFADFSSKTWQKRRDAGKKQGLVRACKPKPGLRILDATAGWGRDAAVLASFGAEVLMLEREPIMAALLRDALNRQDERAKANLKLQLCEMDACSYLNALTPDLYPDVIYIDPMHPERQKSALVKKDMQVLKALLGPDENPLGLLELALTRALQRVVVKWPQQAAPLMPSAFSMPGKVVRFDVYSVPLLKG
ncbi:MAG: class I SAM-dependent methyltransferase [Tatlockia sp.]|jgi:16S rRNA (guanine1516-N2)-methyltransferase